ncbi:MAG: holo-ACP synthase [Nitrospirota bacterium]
MIYGIGTDIIDIERLRHAVQRWGDRLLHKIFTDHEIAYCYRRKDPIPSLAARFAAKEAFIKALGKAVPFHDIEVANKETGKPFINFNSRLKKYIGSALACHVTLSHERGYAIATVILERRGN